MDSYSLWGDENLDPPARRLTVRLSNGATLGVSAPAGVSDRRVLTDLFRIQKAVAKGRTRRVVNIDGKPGYRFDCTTMKRLPDPVVPWKRFTWRVAVAGSYIEMWWNMLAARTWRRAAVKAEIDQLRKDILG